MLRPGIDYLYSFQGYEGYGVIRRHVILRVTATIVVIDECPIGFTWPRKAIDLSRADIENNGKTVVDHDAYFLEPEDSWWEGWRFGGPPRGLIAATDDPEVADRLRHCVEAGLRRKSAEQGYAESN